MLIEILEILRNAAADVLTSTLNSSRAVISAIIKIFQIFKDQGASASPFEKIVIVLFSLLVIYALYKFLWGSAKVIVIFAIIVFLLFFIGTFLS